MGRWICWKRFVIARRVAEIFFPQRPALGLHQRHFSPAVVDKIVSANAEQKSAASAKRQLGKLAEIDVSVPLIMELSAEIGQELQEHLQQQSRAHAAQELQPQHAEPPNLAVVAMDGGRIMTRAEAGRGVHGQAWKETKNACLQTMSSTVSQEDPHPQLPACFSDRPYVEKLVREIHASRTGQVPKEAETGDFSADLRHDVEDLLRDEPAAGEPSCRGDSAPSAERKKESWRPQRLVRTCLSSMACSDDFGPLVAAEAQRRGFYDASRRAFLGDGQAWNWTLQARHFSDFETITDFVHPLGYVYDAARVLAPDDPWPVYLQATEACWQGRVTDVLTQLRTWQIGHPTPEGEKLPEHDPRTIVQAAVTYLQHNQARMNYPLYRRAGLPVTSAMIESLIKEMNYRVKGTEKFWNRPQGADHILHIRAAVLGDEDRLSQWILNRPGSYFYRRQHPLASAA